MFSIIEIEEGRFGKKICSSFEIKKGTVILHFTGSPMSLEESKKLGDDESFAFQVNEDHYIFLDEPARYFNHSCEPNCGVTPGLELVALYDIPEGEELFYDYSTSMLERHWTMACECHKKSCRHLVEDFDQLPLPVQQKYLDLNVVQAFIVRLLNQ